MKTIKVKSKPIPYFNTGSDKFNFKLLIDKLQISEPEYININWDRFEDIDKFRLMDFSNNLKIIWYVGPDDIEVFPDDVS